jgi:uncharacterized protein YdhG (YjbR/CyaY superfamily)
MRGNSPKDVDEYLSWLRPEYREALQNLRDTIRAAAPKATEVISYKIPAFRYQGMLVYYAAFENHLSFFVGSPSARRKFAPELKEFAAGKGTVHFTPDHPLPTELVERIVKERVAENERKGGRR